MRNPITTMVKISGGMARASFCASSGPNWMKQPSVISVTLSPGTPISMKGMRLPKRVRNRSLRKLIQGLAITLMQHGTVPRRTPIAMLLRFICFRKIGSNAGVS